MFKKTKILLLLLILAATSVITGCLTANLGPKFTKPAIPGQGKSVIYVYRQRGVMTADTLPGIKMNDVEIVDILPEISYFAVSVEPGRYTFTPKLFGIYKTKEAAIDARAGEVYYVRLKVQISYFEFEEMNKDEAMAYMATCYGIDPKYALDPRVMTGKNNPAQRPVKETSQAVETIEKESTETPAYEAAEEVPEAPKQEFVEVKSSKGQIYVDSDPSNAKIRIMNIGPVFKQGIELDAGRYDIDIRADGYLPYREWVELRPGEEKYIKVDLEPKFLEEAEPEKVIETDYEPVTVVTIIEETKIPAGLPPEEERYAEMLKSGSLTDLRNAAKNVYYRYYESEYLTKVAEQALLENYEREASSIHIDAMAGCAKFSAEPVTAVLRIP